MKILKRTGLVFLSLIALLGIWIGVNSIDDHELSPEAQEMLKPFPEVPPEKNGYELIRYLGTKSLSADVYHDQLQQLVEGKIQDATLREKILSENQQVIRDVTQSTQRPRFKFPTPRTYYELVPYGDYMRADLLLLLDSEQSADNNNIRGSLQKLSSSVKFCQAIQFEENHLLVSYMIGSRCVINNIRIIHKITSTPQLTKDDYDSAMNIFHLITGYRDDNFIKTPMSEIRLSRQIREEWSNKDFHERIKILQPTKDYRDNDLYTYIYAMLPRYFYLPNHHTSNLASFYLKIQQQPLNYCKDISIPDKNTPELIFKLLPDRLSSPEWSYGNTLESRCLAHTYYDAVKTIIAFHSYEHEHQALPKELDELVPTYLDKLPVDYFDGQTLRYSSEHRWLYSVGTDFKDDKGSKEGYNKGTCVGSTNKEACNTNPTFPIDWKDYPVPVK